MGDGRFEAAVIEMVRGIAPGEGMTYGEVAAEAGHPGAGRAVGNLLRRIATPLPWWRVVGADGRLRRPVRAEQARLLAAEGVAVTASDRVPTTPAGAGP